MIAGRPRTSGLFLGTHHVNKFARVPGRLLEKGCEAQGSLPKPLG